MSAISSTRTPRRDTQEGLERVPTHLYMETDLTAYQNHSVALQAVAIARRSMPKFSGNFAREIQPLWGHGYFGLRWDSPAVWYQEVGIRSFTMTRIAGKTIPMWIKDPTGVERQKNPKAEVRLGEDGAVRVLIFRRAAKMGQRKVVMRQGQSVNVPASYPGAPGRIAVREMARPYTRQGKIGGQIAGGAALVRPNIGVRWRHPGLVGRGFLHRGLVQAALESGLDHQVPVWATTNRWK